MECGIYSECEMRDRYVRVRITKQEDDCSEMAENRIPTRFLAPIRPSVRSFVRLCVCVYVRARVYECNCRRHDHRSLPHTFYRTRSLPLSSACLRACQLKQCTCERVRHTKMIFAASAVSDVIELLNAVFFFFFRSFVLSLARWYLFI